MEGLPHWIEGNRGGGGERERREREREREEREREREREREKREREGEGNVRNRELHDGLRANFSCASVGNSSIDV